MSGFNEKGIKNLSLQRRLNALGPQIAFLLNYYTTYNTKYRLQRRQYRVYTV